MHFNTAQSRSAWTEQEDEMLRQAVAKFGDRAWATVANDVPGRSSKSCSDRWRNFLSPDIEHPRKSPFTEWEVAVVVQAQHRYGNNWKAISMLLPGRTNRAVKNLFVGNLKWGARLPEIKNKWLENGMTLEELLEIKPDHAGGPVRLKPGQHYPAASGSPSSIRAASTSSAGSAWASDITDQPLSGSPASQGTHHHHGGADRRKRGDAAELAGAGQSPPLSKRRRGAPSPVMHSHGYMHSSAYSPTATATAVHPGALGPGVVGSPTLGNIGATMGLAGAGDMAGLGLMGPPGGYSSGAQALLGIGGAGGAMFAVKQRVSANGGGGDPLLLPNMALMDEGSPALGGAGYGGSGRAGQGRGGNNASNMGAGLAGAGIPGLPVLMGGQQQLQQQSGQQLVGHMAGWGGQSSGGGCSSPFAAVAGQSMAAQGSRGGSMAVAGAYMGHQPGGIMPKAEPMQLEGGDCTGNMAAYMQQQQQQQHQTYWDPMAMAQYNQQQQQLQQQQDMHSQQQQQQQRLDVMQQQQQHQQQPAHRQGAAGFGPHQVPGASLGNNTSTAGGLTVPGSPGLANVLPEMHSHDSIALQQILDQMLDDEGGDILADPQLAKLTQETLQHQQHQHQVQVQGPVQGSTAHGMMGQVAGSHHQQQHQQHGSAGGAAPACLEAMAAGHGTGSPRSLMRSSTWPNAWSETAPDSAAAAATGGACVPPAAAGPASFSGPVSSHHHHAAGGGVPPLPPRSISATGSGLCGGGAMAQPGLPQVGGGPDSAQAVPGWGWGGPSVSPHAGLPAGPSGPHSMPSSMPGSGPPSNSGMAPQQQQYMHLMCHQLQQENIMLMQRVATLQNRLASSQELQAPCELGISIPGASEAAAPAPAPTPTGAAPPPAAAAATEVAAVAAAAVQDHSVLVSPAAAGAAAAGPAASGYPADSDLPRLPPVATRVAGSAGGAGAAAAAGGWSGGMGLERRHSGLAGLGSGRLGSGNLGLGSGALKDELQVSPDGSFTPGELLDGCMVDALITDEELA